MTDEPPKDFAPRRAARAPIQVKVNLEFEKFSGFITEYSSNISEGGMFIASKDPKPVGTILSFEFKLKDNFKLVQGLGEVTWVRAEDQGPGHPKGMGIRFHEIDERSRELIRTMVDRHIKEGGKPFHMEGGAAPPAKAPLIESESVLETEPEPEPSVLDDLFLKPELPPAPAIPELKSTAALPDAPEMETEFKALFDETEEVPSSEATLVASDPAPSGPTIPMADAREDREDFREMGLIVEDESFSTDASISDRLEPERKPSTRRIRTWPKQVRRAVLGAVLVATPFLAWKFFSPQIKGAWKTVVGTDRPKPKDVISYEDNFTAKAPRDEPSPKETPAPTVAPVSEPESAVAAKEPDLKTSPVPPTPVPLEAQESVAVKPAPPKPEAPPAKKEPPKVAVAPSKELPRHKATVLNAVTQISWKNTEHETIVVLAGNGTFEMDSISQTRLDGASPRELIRISGIMHPMPKPKMSVHTAQLKQIRSGIHGSPSGSELHVVLDLASPKVKLAKIEPEGSKLLLHLSSQ